MARGVKLREGAAFDLLVHILADGGRRDYVVAALKDQRWSCDFRQVGSVV